MFQVGDFADWEPRLREEGCKRDEARSPEAQCAYSSKVLSSSGKPRGLPLPLIAPCAAAPASIRARRCMLHRMSCKQTASRWLDLLKSCSCRTAKTVSSLEPGLFCLACVGGWRLVNVTTTKNWPSMDEGGEDISLRYWAVLLSGPRAQQTPSVFRRRRRRASASSTCNRCFHLDADQGLAMRGVSLHHPSIYSSQPSRPSILLSPPSLAPHQSHKAPRHSPWSTSTQPTPPSQIARMESEAIQETETEKMALSSLFALCPVPCCWCCCLLCVKPIPPAHRRRPLSPTDDGHGPPDGVPDTGQ